MEVVLHYRPLHNGREELQTLAAGSLEDFPVRRLPTFVPWFPCHVQNFILKPQRRPPFISVEPSSRICYDPFDPVHVQPSICHDPTPSLLEFKPNVRTNTVDDEQTPTSETDDFMCGPPPIRENVSKENTQARSWSICTQRASSGDTIIPPSEDLKGTLDRLKLNLFHRGRWTIVQSVCGGLSLEVVWGKLSRLMRHIVLPSCNATMRKDLGEIWIFCDLRYCEHIGTSLRSELKLSGRIDLFVHKHGIILSM